MSGAESEMKTSGSATQLRRAADFALGTVLVTGAARSGSNFLTRLLDGHKELFNTFDEIYLLEYIESLDNTDAFLEFFFEGEIGAVIESVHERGLLPLLRGPMNESDTTVKHDYKIVFDEPSFVERLGRLREGRPRTVRALWSTWFEALAGPAQANRVVVKSNDYYLSARAAWRHLDDVWAVFTIRHPVQALSSRRALWEIQGRGSSFGTCRLIEELDRYKQMNKLLYDVSQDQTVRLKVVRYEDLVANTEQTIRAVAKFLGVEFDPCFLSPTVNGMPWYGNSAFGRVEGMAVTEGQRENKLSETEKKLVARHLEGFMSDFDYA